VAEPEASADKQGATRIAIDVGSRIRDYEIVARLKSGGMATLFLARRSGVAGFSRHVAIKVEIGRASCRERVS
jgi:hypothetical protein